MNKVGVAWLYFFSMATMFCGKMDTNKRSQQLASAKFHVPLTKLSLKTVCFIRLQSGSQTFAQIWTFRTWMHVSGKGCDLYTWNFLEFQGLFHNVVCCALSSHLSPFVKRCACHVIILWRSEVSDVTKAETLHCKKTLKYFISSVFSSTINPKTYLRLSNNSKICITQLDFPLCENAQ